MRLNVICLIQIQIFTLTLSSQIFSKVSISWILNFWSELRILQLGNRSNKQLVNALPHSKWDKPKSIDIKSTWQNFCLHLNPKRLINIREKENIIEAKKGYPFKKICLNKGIL